MKQIKDLFHAGTQPFYAGFGNRDTDYIAYKTMAISVSKIFIINPQGEIKQHK